MIQFNKWFSIFDWPIPGYGDYRELKSGEKFSIIREKKREGRLNLLLTIKEQNLWARNQKV